MDIKVRFKLDLHRCHHRSSLLFVCLLFLIMLVSSCFVSVFSSSNGFSPFVLGASNKVVSNETELRNAINNAAGSTIITLNKDITLTETTLTIPAGKEITLTSNKATGYYKLISADGKSTITVEGSGALRLDGIIVTHTKNAGKAGGGVYVEANGQIILYSGEISDNTVVGGGSLYDRGAVGGGVFNLGVFEMSGGKISKNSATGLNDEGSGGGVANRGTFIMSGGEISNNNANVGGGGVHNVGVFTMSGGKIINNYAGYWGGGVSTFGTFERLGGVISDNTAVVNGDNVHPNDSGNSEGSSNGSGSGDGGGSSNGNGGSGGNSNGSGSGGDNGLPNSSGSSIGDGFSLREVIIICIGVIGITIGVVMTVLFFTSKKKL
jgi:hypothetical protein